MQQGRTAGERQVSQGVSWGEGGAETRRSGAVSTTVAREHTARGVTGPTQQGKRSPSAI